MTQMLRLRLVTLVYLLLHWLQLLRSSVDRLVRPEIALKEARREDDRAVDRHCLTNENDSSCVGLGPSFKSFIIHSETESEAETVLRDRRRDLSLCSVLRGTCVCQPPGCLLAGGTVPRNTEHRRSAFLVSSYRFLSPCLVTRDGS